MEQQERIYRDRGFFEGFQKWDHSDLESVTQGVLQFWSPEGIGLLYMISLLPLD